ncbi:hypothetical protein ACQY0O_003791 [Thecaphora frezii]
MKEAFSMPLQGFDAIRNLSQIASLQALHYLLLCVLIPPLLSIFSSPTALAFEGGSTQVGMVLDWRELSGLPTWDWNPSLTSWGPTSSNGRVGQAVEWKNAVWDQDGKQLKAVDETDRINQGEEKGEEGLRKWEWTHTKDDARGWCIAAAWLGSCAFDIILLVFLVRRPTHILDHALTLHFNHFVITSYYSASLPTSFFWWCTMTVHAGITIVWAEQLAIKRELNRSIGHHLVGPGSTSISGSGAAGSAKHRQGPKSTSRVQDVLFDGTEYVELRSLA